MKKIIKYFKGQPVTFLPTLYDNKCMVNGIELAKILNINLFEWLENNKERIRFNTNESLPLKVREEEPVKIEGSDEVYLHPFVTFGLVMLSNELYIWFFDTHLEVRKELFELELAETQI